MVRPLINHPGLWLLVSLLLLFACTNKTDKGLRSDIVLTQQYSTLEEKRLTFTPVPITSDIVITSLDQPQNGELINQGFGSYDYRPGVEFSGREVLAFELSDGRSGTIMIDVQAVNDKPVAIADVATILGNTAVTIPVLENDVDLDNTDLTVTAVGTPEQGSVVNNNDGTLTYTPPDQFTGRVAFSYTVSDAEYSVDALVTVFALSELSLVADPRMDPRNIGELREGKTVHWRVLGDTSLQGTLELTNLMQWLSSDSNIVEIGNYPGTLLAKAPGTVTITAQVGEGESRIRARGQITVLANPPATPKDFAISQLTGADIDTPTIQVSWTISDGISYNLYSKPQDGVVKVIPGAKPPYLDKGLSEGKVYQYWLSAINSGGESIPSKQLGLRVKAPVVLPPPPPPPVAGVDLEITSVTIDKTAGDLRHGEAIDVTFVVKNNGAQKYSSSWNTKFKVGITMDPDPQPRGMLILNDYEEYPQLAVVIENLDSGQSLEKTVTYHVGRRFAFERGTGLGEYYLRVIADSANHETESNETNNEYVVPVKFNLVEDDNEDLVVSALSVSSNGTPIGNGAGETTSLTVNDPLHFDYTVENIGDSDTWEHYIVFYLLFDSFIPRTQSAGNLKQLIEAAGYLAYQRIDGVAAHGKIQGSVDTFIPYGYNTSSEPLTFVAYVDRWGDIGQEQLGPRFGGQKEKDDYNNIRIMDPTVLVSPTGLLGPNLVLTDFTIVGNRASLLDQEQFAVNFTIENQGDMTSHTGSPVTRGLYVDAVFSNVNFTFVYQVLPELAPGEIISGVNISAVSTHFVNLWYSSKGTVNLPLSARIDPGGFVAESDKTDNSQTINVDILQENYIDYAVTDVQLPQGNDAVAGEQLDVQYTVANQGATTGWPIFVKLSMGNGSQTRYIPIIKPGESVRDHLKIQVPVDLQPGAVLEVMADSFDKDLTDTENLGSYTEVDTEGVLHEDNNIQTVALNVLPSPLSMTAEISPGNAGLDHVYPAGMVSKATVVVTNNGGIPSQGAIARVTMDRNCTAVGENCINSFLNSIEIAPLAAGGSVTRDIDFQIPYSTASNAIHSIHVELVSLVPDAFIDSTIVQIDVIDDLNPALTPGSLAFSQPTSDTIVIDASVKNASLYVNTPDDTSLVFCLTDNIEAVGKENCMPGGEIGIAHVPALAPGASYPMTGLQFTLPKLAAQTYYLLVYIDDQAWQDLARVFVVDSDPTNNVFLDTTPIVISIPTP